MKYDSVIFDLDGTLWNSTPEIFKSWTEVFSKYDDLKLPTFDEIMACMGLSDIDLMKKLFPDIKTSRARELFGECNKNENIYLTKHGATHYEGVYELLETLSKKTKVFIVSNCGLGYIESYMSSMKTEPFITDFECFGNTRKPKSDNIESVVKRNNLQNPVYVGDTVWDMESAKKAGVDFIYATYGFGDFNCNYEKIEKPLDLLNLLGE